MPISPASRQPLRFGSNISIRQFVKSMGELGFEKVRGGRHAHHLSNGDINLPYSEGRKNGSVGDHILHTYAHALGIPLKLFKAYLQNPKQNQDFFEKITHH